MREGITILELALWNATLAEEESSAGRTKKAKIDAERKEGEIHYGADVLIKRS